MTLSDRRIRRRLDAKSLVIAGMMDGAINRGRWLQPASVDVRLDRYFAALTGVDEQAIIDPAVDNSHLFTGIRIDDDRASVLVPPGGSVLASTYEWLSIPPDLAGHVHGKSSNGRLFLQIHSTAGLLDPGWRGYVTLEVTNLSPHHWRLWPGMRIAQITFSKVKGGAARPYGSTGLGSHYQDQQRGPVLPRGYIGFTHGLPAEPSEPTVFPDPPPAPPPARVGELPRFTRLFMSRT